MNYMDLDETDYDMFPVIDVEKTSLNFKEIREKNNIKVSTVQKYFHFENPQAIYLWENPKSKTFPNIDHLIGLAKLYNVSLDDLFVIKYERRDTPLGVCSPMEGYYYFNSEIAYKKYLTGIEYIKTHTSDNVFIAFKKFYADYHQYFSS